MNTAAPNNTADLSDLPGVLSTEEQRRAFGKARRHTIGVKVLKYFMPLLSAGIISLYLLPDKNIPAPPKLSGSIEGIGLSSKGLKMINPRYAGSSEKLGSYEVQAEYALQQITAAHVLELHKLTGRIEQPDKKWTRLKATKGIYDTKKESMDLQDGILITTNQGMEAKLKTARVNMKKQLIITDQPVQMKMNGNTIDASAMTLNTAQKRVLFTGGVKVKLLRNKSMTR